MEAPFAGTAGECSAQMVPATFFRPPQVSLPDVAPMSSPDNTDPIDTGRPQGRGSTARSFGHPRASPVDMMASREMREWWPD